MAFLSASDRAFVGAVSKLVYCNPFLPEGIECERAALGAEFVEGEPVWSLPVDQPERPRANVWRVVEKLEPLAEQLRARINADAREEDLALYEDAVRHLLYQRYYGQLVAGEWHCYPDFLADLERFFPLGGGWHPLSCP